MTEHQKSFPEFYVTASQPCPYLPGRRERKLFTHITYDKPPGFIDTLLKGGFRRSQNIAYMPYCDGCQACLSIRVVVNEFRPGRSFRKNLARNCDIVARRVAPRPTSEQYALFRSYIDTRHGDGGMADMSVLDFAMMIEDTLIDTHLVEYRLKPRTKEEENHGARSPSEKWLTGGTTGRADEGRLVAVALCDALSDGLSMVYSFYDPALEARSLGTFMILEHLRFAESLGKPYLYLGYWIAGSRKMHYKQRFQPQEYLGRDGWERVGGGHALLQHR